MTGQEIICEKSKAIQEGYAYEFGFGNGRIYDLLYPEQTYAASHVVEEVCFCEIEKCRVYRIITPSGKKGYAVVPVSE